MSLHLSNGGTKNKEGEMTMKGFYSRAELGEIAAATIGDKKVGGVSQGVLEATVAQNYELGTLKQIGMCKFRYGLAGTVDLAPGKLAQSPIPDALQVNLVPAANYAVGVKVITVSAIGNANVAVNEYAGGWLYINAGTGVGQALRILSHPAALALAACTFACLDPLTVALATSDTKISLLANPYRGTVVHPSPPTAGLIGVPIAPITTAKYGWFQTAGPCPVLTDGTVYIYQQVTPSVAVDGAVKHAVQSIIVGAEAAIGTKMAKIANSAGAASVGAITGTDGAYGSATIDIGSLQTIVGRVLRVGADTEYSLVFLTLE